MPELVANQIDRYPIIRKLGEGGMGVVYLCRDATGREVAIKTLKPGLPDNVKRRFKEEGNRADLTHDNIVTIYTVSDEEVDPPYIVMEYLDGDGLNVLIKAGNRLTLADKLDIIGQVCRGLDYAHAKGVIHRDIKPENIIRIRDSGRIKIVDFGISKVKREMDTAGLSQTQLVGTVGYIAPERWLGQLEDGRVDIFSTGVMLYFLLTGREPFVLTDGEAPGTVMHRILRDPFPPLSTYLREFPEALTNVLERALAKDPSDRYYTGMEFADDLALLTDELNRRRVPELLEEAERHLAEGNWQQARRRCQEALKTDPQNADARRLLREADNGRKAQDVELRLQRLLAEAEEALETRRYDDAVRLLQEADRLRPGTPQLQEKLQAARDAKRVQDEVERLIRQAGMDEHAGDLTGPYQMYQQASLLAPNNPVVLREMDRLGRKIEEEEGRKKNERHIFNAEQKIAARQFTEALEILDGVRRSRIGHEKLDALYEEALRGRGQKEAGRLKEQVEIQATKLRNARQYEQALTELDRGLDALKGDTDLFRLYQDVKAEFEEFERNRWIDETVESVREQSLASIDDALATLREAMRRLPGVARFASLETALLERKKNAVNEQVRSACLREAGEELGAGRPERAIQAIEAYLLKYAGDADVDGLLQTARRALEQQRLRRWIAECAAAARALIDQERFEEALGVIEPVLKETRDPELTELCNRAAEGKEKVDAEVRQLARRITELRHNLRLGEAIALIEGQGQRLLRSPSLRELLEALRKELARDEALGEAIARSRRAVEATEWPAAREPLDNIRRVYGEFPALTQAVAEFETMRARAADRSVGTAIESAKAAILAGDKKAAIKTLEATAGPAAFASAAVLQERKRLADELKVEAPVPGQVVVTKQSGIPGWAIGVAALVVAVVAVVLWRPWRKPPEEPPVVPVETSVRIKSVPGATVQIGNLPLVTTDDKGEAKVVVQPGPNLSINVTREDFTPFSENLDVEKGDKLVVQAPLIDKRTTGNLILKGNVTQFKVFVDGNLLGTKFTQGVPIPIAQGSHTVQYEADGFERSVGAKVEIVKGANLNAAFTLTPKANSAAINDFSASPATVGEDGGSVTLKWKIANAKKVLLDGEDVTGRTSKQVNVSADTKYTLTAVGDDGKSINGYAGVSVSKPAPPNIISFTASPSEATAGQSIRLSWKTAAASGVILDHNIGPRDPEGTADFLIPPGTTGLTPFRLTAKGKREETSKTLVVMIAETPKPLPPQPARTEAAGADTAHVQPPMVERSVLESALNSFGSRITTALTKDEKGCKAALGGLSGMISPGLKVPLESLGRRCGDVRTVTVAPLSCGAPRPNGPDHAAMLCEFSFPLTPKSGDPVKNNYAGSNFVFAKSASGGWTVEKWEWPAH